MQNVPKIVVDRLKAAPSALCHPEADVLTAFAEHSLPGRERAELVDHLARCGPCREIVMLAMPAADEIQVVVRPSRAGWLTWPALRWGVAAAGVVVVAALGIVEHQKTAKPSIAAFMPMENNNAVVSEPKADSTGQARASSSSPVASSASNRAMARDKALTDSESKLTVGLPAASGVAASRIAPSPIPHQPARGASGNLVAYGPAMPTQQQAQQQLAQANAAVGGPISHSSQMVAVQAASPALQAPTRQSSAGSTQLEAQNQPAPAESLFANGELVRAKPAMKAEFGPQWMVTAVGGLQRSFDQGNSWQDVNVMANLTSPVNGRSFAALSAVAPAGAKQNSTGAVSAQPDLANADAAKSDSAQSSSTNQNLYKKAAAASDKNAALSALTPLFRTVTANGGDVWAGGTVGSLYHSVDAGNHWTRVVPSTSAGATLTGDVIRVEFADAQHGTVATSTSETWTTSDGGQTWQKQ